MKLTRTQKVTLAYLALLTICMWLFISGLLGQAAQPVQQQIDTSVPADAPTQNGSR